MTEPFFVSLTHTGQYKSHIELQQWTSRQADVAREKGGKFARVSTHPGTGDVVYEAWLEENPKDLGEPRWPKKET